MKKPLKRFHIFRRIFKFHGFFESLKLALNGFAYLILYHRNMRIIIITGIIAFAAGIVCKLRGIELAVLCLAITAVFMAEMFNTAIEMMIDMFTKKYRTLIKLVKDIAAAVVLIASLNAVGVGIVLFWKHFWNMLTVIASLYL
jgi:diacylglycerol kinase